MRIKSEMRKSNGRWNKKTTQLIKLIQIKKIATKRAGTRSYRENTWNTIVKCCKSKPKTKKKEKIWRKKSQLLSKH